MSSDVIELLGTGVAIKAIIINHAQCRSFEEPLQLVASKNGLVLQVMIFKNGCGNILML